MKLLASAFLLCVVGSCGSSSDLDAPSTRPVVLDPVCSEPVDPSTPWKGRFRENVYSFHSEACRDRFAAHPEYYAFGPYPQRGTRVQGDVKLFPDPVCGRETPLTRWRTEHDGRVYTFHDHECLLEFRFRPQAYVGLEARTEAR